MSDISIPGVSSKYNTTKLVEDLVAAERIRLTRMEEDVTALETTRSTWRDVNRDFGELQRSAKSLYGFENPFSEKSASSSNERVLTATAGRTAPFDDYSIVVRQVATADRFLTPSLSRSHRIEEGTYTFRIGDREVSLRYRGGTVEDFARRLSEKGEGLVRASTVRDTPDTQVLLIEAIPTGAANRLIFEEDARTLGLQTGMMRESRTTEGGVSVQSVAAEPRSPDGRALATENVVLSGEGILVKPGVSLSLPFTTPTAVEPGMVLEYSYRTVDYSDEELAPPVPPGPAWPDAPEGRYGGLVIRGAPNTFKIPSAGVWNIPSRIETGNVLEARSDSQSLPLPAIVPSETYRTVRIESDGLPPLLTGLVLNNGNTHRGIEIQGIRLYDPARAGNLEPVNPAGIAGDAIIEFRGIEARRPTNEIADLVDGLTINLKRASPDPVDLVIEPDTETAKDGVIRFVFNYNRLLTRILVLTSDDPAVIDELDYLTDDERESFEEQLGSMRGELTLNQLKNRLQSIVTSPYTTRAGADLALLAQIGVSTNASSGNGAGALDFSKLRGYLEIDEEKLDTVLENNIDAVKDLFGRDTTGDLVIDSGVAQGIDAYLTPYTQTGGFVSGRIAGIDRQIDSRKDDISDYEEYLEDYEADLRRQYGIMEATLNQLENSSRDLDNFSRQQNSGR